MLLVLDNKERNSEKMFHRFVCAYDDK